MLFIPIRTLAGLLAILVLASASQHARAQSESQPPVKTVTNAEVVYNNDGTISVTLTIADTNPVAIDLMVRPQVVEPGAQCIGTGETYNEALSNYRSSCSVPVSDCDPYNGSWYCSSTDMAGKPPLQVVNITSDPTTTPQTTATPEPKGATTTTDPQTLPVSSVVVTLPTPDGGQSDQANDGRSGVSTPSTRGKIAGKDLLVLHYDNAPDLDDGHALVAGRVLKDFYGIENVISVNGAHGYKRRNDFKQNSEPLFKAAWPSGLNAYRDWAGSVATSASLWSETVSQGGKVWVADGGPMDFTADVLRAMPADQRNSVTVVQHSHGWNEDNTRPDNVRYVDSQTNYVRIDNGNLGGNDTADLNRKSASFVQVALASQWGDLWQAAFAYLSPDSKLDFSDTVEFLWLLDIPLNVVANPDDFAEQYLR